MLSSAEEFKVAIIEQGPVFLVLKQTQIEKRSAFDIEDKVNDAVPSSDPERFAVLRDAEEAMHCAEFEYEESGPGTIRPVVKNSQPSALSCRLDVTSSNTPAHTSIHNGFQKPAQIFSEEANEIEAVIFSWLTCIRNGGS
jgi:hypothetical protein